MKHLNIIFSNNIMMLPTFINNYTISKLMTGSLAVFKLINPDREKLMKKENDSKPQYNFADFDLSDSLGQSRSKLIFRNYDAEHDRIYYSATHYSETIKSPVRFFLDDIEGIFSNTNLNIENLPRGTHTVNSYQAVDIFDVAIDLKVEEIFVFVNKRVANNFMKRFKKSGFFNYEKIFFDMDKIENIPDLSNIWGLWENSTGRCKKKAYFGTEVHKHEEVDKKKVTAYNVNLEYDDGTVVNLSIMIDCRLSSTSKIITNDELFDTYQLVKEHLGFSDVTDRFIEVFEEET